MTPRIGVDGRHSEENIVPINLNPAFQGVLMLPGQEQDDEENIDLSTITWKLLPRLVLVIVFVADVNFAVTWISGVTTLLTSFYYDNCACVGGWPCMVAEDGQNEQLVSELLQPVCSGLVFIMVWLLALVTLTFWAIVYADEALFSSPGHHAQESGDWLGPVLRGRMRCYIVLFGLSLLDCLVAYSDRPSALASSWTPEATLLQLDMFHDIKDTIVLKYDGSGYNASAVKTTHLSAMFKHTSHVMSEEQMFNLFVDPSQSVEFAELVERLFRTGVTHGHRALLVYSWMSSMSYPVSCCEVEGSWFSKLRHTTTSSPQEQSYSGPSQVRHLLTSCAWRPLVVALDDRVVIHLPGELCQLLLPFRKNRIIFCERKTL